MPQQSVKKDIMAVITRVGGVKSTTKGQVLDIDVQELSTRKFYNVDVWLNDQEFCFNENDEIVIGIKAGKVFKGRQRYYSNMNWIEGVNMNGNAGGVEAPAPLPSPAPKSQKIVARTASNIPEPETDEMGIWLTYRQRLNEIIELFKSHEVNSDTALAGAILGLRELMGKNRL